MLSVVPELPSTTVYPLPVRKLLELHPSTNATPQLFASKPEGSVRDWRILNIQVRVLELVLKNSIVIGGYVTPYIITSGSCGTHGQICVSWAIVAPVFATVSVSDQPLPTALLVDLLKSSNKTVCALTFIPKTESDKIIKSKEESYSSWTSIFRFNC